LGRFKGKLFKVPKKKADGILSKLMENKVVETAVVDAETKADGNKRAGSN